MRHRKTVGKYSDLREEAAEAQDAAMSRTNSQKSFFSWKLPMENQLMKTADFLCLPTARTSSSLQLLTEKNPTSCL
jgi:hypothetical protein